MQASAWIQHVFHVDTKDLTPEVFGTMWAKCKWIMKCKGYTFK